MATVKETIQKLKGKESLDERQMKIIEELIEQASEAYYNTGSEIMSDEEFDTLTREFKRLGGTVKVGANAPKGKGTVDVKHSFEELVGTLDKTNFIFESEVDDDTKKSVQEWLMKNIQILKKAGLKKLTLGISFKFDGNSVVIEYRNGKLHIALTRGRDGKGMDLSHVFKDHTIVSKDNIGIKYEVIISWDNYKKLMEDTGLSYANPRSLVSGKLGDDNAYDYYKYMTLVPLWIKPSEGFMERIDQLEFIEENFGEENDLFSDYRLVEDVSVDDLTVFFDELTDMYNHYKTARYGLPFMIDGLVIEILDQEARDVLGYVNDEPNWATALKFPYMEKTTKVSGFDFTLGDSGIITSRVWFEPVEFNGTIHEKQSLQNYKRFKELGLGIGSEVLIQYRNDCLTYVVPINSEHNKTITPSEYTSECPVCGGHVEITKTGAFAYCANDFCEGKIVGKVQNFLTKMDIKGIKESTITKLRDAGLVNSITDMYNLKFEDVSKVEGLGDVTAINIIGAMSSKVPYDYEILGALGIQSFSTSKAKELCKEYSLQELRDKTIYNATTTAKEITNLEGFSDITATYIVEGILNNDDVVTFLLNRPHKVFKEEAKKFSNVASMSIVFTNFRNEALQTQLEMMGHKVKSAVSGKTDVVVCPDPDGKSTKLDKARTLGKRIVSVDDFKVEMGLS
jgi:DNA ligase (NAD+)